MTQSQDPYRSPSDAEPPISHYSLPAPNFTLALQENISHMQYAAHTMCAALCVLGFHIRARFWHALIILPFFPSPYVVMWNRQSKTGCGQMLNIDEQRSRTSWSVTKKKKKKKFRNNLGAFYLSHKLEVRKSPGPCLSSSDILILASSSLGNFSDTFFLPH